MKNLLFFFCLIPFVSFSQIIISANVIERTDTKKKITNILDLSIGSFINNDLIVGITNEEAVSDYTEHGFNPIQDRFIVSKLQLFIKYYDDKGYFFLMKIPTSSNIKGISIYDRIRVGGGYVFYSDHNLDFHVSYNVLLSSNLNRWGKGELSLGISKDISDLHQNKKGVKLLTSSFHSRLLNRFISWINTPLSNGYREFVLN
jgi:hypothetical protein